MVESPVQLEASWLRHLQSEFDQEYMRDLRRFLIEEKQAGKTVYPPADQMFNALDSTAFDDVKVVILGQDPYHGPGQAHGLSFSVPPGVRMPPSLKNIFKEINEDLGLPVPDHGCLQTWADQGVLLLNATLSVVEGAAGSHQKKGWERFTDRVIHSLSEEREGLVFMLWGNYAQKKGAFIDPQKHCVLKSVHPSPLSAHRGFLGCGHFSQANQFLQGRGEQPIDWSLPPL